jgi:hypothetical protein
MSLDALPDAETGVDSLDGGGRMAGERKVPHERAAGSEGLQDSE